MRTAVKAAALVTSDAAAEMAAGDRASAFHMPRTIACFRKAGWNVLPVPASYMTDRHSFQRVCVSTWPAISRRNGYSHA